MKRCKATTKDGRRCLNGQRTGTDFCAIHASEISSGELFATAAGALVGHALIPGLGIVLGGLAGHSFRNFTGLNNMTKKRVFISFDFDNDRVLRDFMLGQARLPDSPFEVIDHSLKEAAPERNWEAKARAAIARSDIVIVMVGNDTHRAGGVLKEIAWHVRLACRWCKSLAIRTGTTPPYQMLAVCMPGIGRTLRSC